jgi:hypothetical protein
MTVNELAVRIICGYLQEESPIRTVGKQGCPVNGPQRLEF